MCPGSNSSSSRGSLWRNICTRVAGISLMIFIATQFTKQKANTGQTSRETHRGELQHCGTVSHREGKTKLTAQVRNSSPCTGAMWIWLKLKTLRWWYFKNLRNIILREICTTVCFHFYFVKIFVWFIHMCQQERVRVCVGPWKDSLISGRAPVGNRQRPWRIPCQGQQASCHAPRL